MTWELMAILQRLTYKREYANINIFSSIFARVFILKPPEGQGGPKGNIFVPNCCSTDLLFYVMC